MGSIYIEAKVGNSVTIRKNEEVIVKGVITRKSFDTEHNVYLHLDNGWVLVFKEG